MKAVEVPAVGAVEVAEVEEEEVEEEEVERWEREEPPQSPSPDTKSSMSSAPPPSRTVAERGHESVRSFVCLPHGETPILQTSLSHYLLIYWTVVLILIIFEPTGCRSLILKAWSPLRYRRFLGADGTRVMFDFDVVVTLLRLTRPGLVTTCHDNSRYQGDGFGSWNAWNEGISIGRTSDKSEVECGKTRSSRRVGRTVGGESGGTVWCQDYKGELQNSRAK